MVDDKVEENINDLLDIEQTHKFREYQQIELELSSYQNSLAYYIALNKK